MGRGSAIRQSVFGKTFGRNEVIAVLPVLGPRTLKWTSLLSGVWTKMSTSFDWLVCWMMCIVRWSCRLLSQLISEYCLSIGVSCTSNQGARIGHGSLISMCVCTRFKNCSRAVSFWNFAVCGCQTGQSATVGFPLGGTSMTSCVFCGHAAGAVVLY